MAAFIIVRTRYLLIVSLAILTTYNIYLNTTYYGTVLAKLIYRFKKDISTRNQESKS